MDSIRFDRLTRTISTRRGVIGRVLAGSMAFLPGVSAVGEAGAARVSCGRGKKRCGKKCIPRSKTCCKGAKKACGKRCIPKSWPCCPASKKRCGKKCIPKSACCTTADCPSLRICANGTCVIGQGVCPDGADLCTSGSGVTDCGAPPNSGDCSCMRTTSGETRCAHWKLYEPKGGSCLNDEECAAAHPTIPGIFCMRGSTSGGGGGRCPGQRVCMAPCPG